ncbi:tail fiber domain-containing protein [Phaeobacter italicus]|uniref:tail fiber domain-containing protein n=1 Tax=Phaeobacter italicus TaxID=481446 RepID=UPI001CD33948|nr:tail fiber domain-containing protein [Phaeobacter italicus]MCA0856154.1 tail fiber domain-containing protein [Phaeobacter italicus]
MYGKKGQFNAARGAAMGLQNAMTQTTRTMNRGPATASFSEANLQPFQQQLRANAAYDPRNQKAADAGVRGARETLAAGQSFQAGQIAQTDLSPYMNQHQGQVINNALSDMDRARQMAQNDAGAQATAAGAFGGSRHALVEAENNRNFAEQAARMAAEQRAAGFDRAQSAAQSDISAQMQGQQLRNASAQANAGIGIQNAQRWDQMRQQNVQNDLQARQIGNQAASIGGSQRLQQAQDRNQNRQFNAGQQMADRGMDLQAAGQLAGQAGQAFNQQNQISSQMMQNGAMQQALQQQLINAGKGQFAGWMGAPQSALNLPLMAVGAAPNVGTQTTTQSGGGPGLMDALGFGASLLPFLSDRRAKEDIRRVGQTDSGLPIYVYRYKGGDTFHMGVMAQEVEAVQPEAVVERPDGLKAVRYDLIEA